MFKTFFISASLIGCSAAAGLALSASHGALNRTSDLGALIASDRAAQIAALSEISRPLAEPVEDVIVLAQADLASVTSDAASPSPQAERSLPTGESFSLGSETAGTFDLNTNTDPTHLALSFPEGFDIPRDPTVTPTDPEPVRPPFAGRIIVPHTGFERVPDRSQSRSEPPNNRFRDAPVRPTRYRSQPPNPVPGYMIGVFR